MRPLSSDVRHALAEVERAVERGPQRRFRRGTDLHGRRPAIRSCARGTGRAAATGPSAALRRRRAVARSPSRAPTSRGPCSSPCAPRPAARAARSCGPSPRAAAARRSNRRSAARSARGSRGSAARRASRTAAAGNGALRSACRPCSCDRRGWCAARSRPSAGCRRWRRRRDAMPAARTAARTR